MSGIIKTKDFEFMNYHCNITDDSVMSLAIAKAILECDDQYRRIETYAVKIMQELGRKYPDAGYGSNFYAWLHEDNAKPYNSYGNGAAMRVSACGFAAFFESTSFEDAIRNAISIGGDSDTIGAITGSLAEAYYGIPADIRKLGLTYLKEDLLKILVDFENVFSPKAEV